VSGLFIIKIALPFVEKNSYKTGFEGFQLFVICRPSMVTTLKEKRSPPLIKEVSLGKNN
jgi:hypothetical protein